MPRLEEIDGHSRKSSTRRSFGAPAESRSILSLRRSELAASLHETRPDPRISTHQDALQLQRLAGNRITAALISGANRGHKIPEENDAARDSTVIQRYREYILERQGPKSPYVNFLFDRRCDDGTATTGVHNYAYVNETTIWARSAQNRHAEMKLLLRLHPKKGDEIEIISELRPCSHCEEDMKAYETDHGVKITVFYLIDYLATGDGNPDVTRDFYKAKKKLTGGGQWNWQIAS